MKVIVIECKEDKPWDLVSMVRDFKCDIPKVQLYVICKTRYAWELYLHPDSQAQFMEAPISATDLVDILK